jgi:hypothetical protein
VLAGELDVTFRTGQPFVMPVAVWISETYDPDLGIPDDTPIARSIFTGSNVSVTLDGKSLIDSEEDDLRKFYFGPEEFDPTFIYEEPTDYGAIGAVAIQGLGFAHPPLSKGTHTSGPVGDPRAGSEPARDLRGRSG